MKVLARHLTKTYDTSKPTLDNLSFELRAGSVLALSGPSGSGKSTFLHLLGLLDTPSSGTLRHNDSNANALSVKGRALLRSQYIGYIFQNYALLEKRTVWQNVALPLLYQGLSLEQSREQVVKTLQQLSMSDWIERKVHQLSGGQKQRVAIARSLVTKPSLILADEPTGALDPSLRDIVWDTLIEAHRQFGASIIMVTHDPILIPRCQLHWSLEGGQLCV